MKNIRNSESGFTLIEMMIAVAIIGVVAAVAIPAYKEHMLKAELVETATKLDSYVKRLEVYRLEYGVYPNDSHRAEPVGLTMPDDWMEATRLGGRFNWEGPDQYPYAGISIEGASLRPLDEFMILDKILDDGNLATGKFRKTGNGRHTYVLDENP